MDKSFEDQEIRKSNAIVHQPMEGPVPRNRVLQQACRQADEIWVRYDSLNACCRLKYSIFRFFNKRTALFKHFWCISSAFFRQTLLQGHFIECEI